MFGNKEMLFAHADAVFPGTGTAHGDGPVVHPFDQGLAAAQFFLVVLIVEQNKMEIAVTDMTDDRRNEA